uniref:Fungal lipase-type domain-containing protein n=1 Tax=Ananas comosus var. bracteatus TaxID=296719 RepID=A0A6V7QP08_ANACO|nr:unnamed protein product [Ananas comosus var. bracteatus]
MGGPPRPPRREPPPRAAPLRRSRPVRLQRLPLPPRRLLPSRHLRLLLPDRSYRPTRSLFATSSLSLPNAVPPWAPSSASASADSSPSPSWLTQRTSWIGYVAVCDSDREVARMGRRDIVVVLRGTATCLEWAENLRTSLVPVDGEAPGGSAGDPSAPKVARGFLNLYKTPGERVPSLSDAVVGEVRRLMDVYKGEELSVTVVGHSLGAALALLVADELSACAPRAPPVAVVSFGGPRVGNRAFAERLERSRGVGVLRIVNAGDVVTRVPGLPHARNGHEHVGTELRLHTSDSPCLRPSAGPACSHDLESYLHLVDGFAGTGRPFRPDARRCIVRLLQLQRASVRASYVKRAFELGIDRKATAATGLSRSDSYGCVLSPS